MPVLLAGEVGHEFEVVALDLPVKDGEAGVGHDCQQEEVEEDKEELLLRSA